MGGGILNESGNILYSSASTLRRSNTSTLQRGPVYLLGTNPGGDPKEYKYNTIQDTLDALPNKTENSYIDEKWGRRPGKQKHPLQRRVIWLLNDLDNNGLKTKDVCASNLIFQRSRNTKRKNIDFKKCADICWPVHERILQVVSPSLIIAFGIETYYYLRSKLGNGNEITFPSGHGTWKCRSFRSDSDILVVGLPHLSRYAVDCHDDVKIWIQRQKW